MEAAQLLLEYLKEQYAQARQHETRQTAATTFLTAAAAAILGLALKDGSLVSGNWWIGLVVALIGVLNLGIIRAHQLGNRYHTKLAGKVRQNIEKNCGLAWGSARTPTELRTEALQEMNLRGPDVSIGGTVYAKLRWIPILVMGLGLSVFVLSLLFGAAEKTACAGGSRVRIGTSA